MLSVGCELGCLLGGGACFAGVKHLLEQTGTRRAPPVGPLAGVKILDIAQVVSAPYGVRLLADLGAEVIKVESLDHPDSCRGLGPTPVRGMPSMWMFVNQMKRSLVLDLKDPKGVEIFKELAKEADVIVQNFRPGAVDRMGIGYEAIKAVNPDIIYVSVSGFGQEGPLSDRRVYDPVIQCMSGFCVSSADENGNRLTPCFLVDKFTSFTVFQACLAALLARARGYGGQKIEISMLEMMVQLLWPDTYSNKVWNVECGGSNPTPIRFYHFWDTKDSHSKLCVKMDTDEEWCILCRDREARVEV
jgi:crotonobetainyl-CoA:carnitine CoA-transferase CaiB-like acyl-CoA transferase